MKNKRLKKMILAVVFVLILLALAVAMLLSSRRHTLDNSEYFDRSFVENAIVETVNLFTQEDYDTLSAIAVEDLQAKFTVENMAKERAKISDDWGNCISYGTIYTSEVVRAGQHYAEGSITVIYENVMVDYRFLYDVDMKLAEFTME